MTPHSKKSQKGLSSSSNTKSTKKSGSILGSMLNSAFTKESSSSSSSKASKHNEGVIVEDDPKEKKRPNSKHTSKIDKRSAAKYAIEDRTSSSSRSKPELQYSRLSKTATVQTGMVLHSALFRDESQVPTHESQPAAPIQSTTPTPTITTAFTSEHDRYMATRQLRIDTLSKTELQEQEVWAQEKLLKSQACPKGWGWQRYTAPEGYSQFNGYRCYGGASTHLVSHELLAEGKNRLYRRDRITKWWEGPFDADQVRRDFLEAEVEDDVDLEWLLKILF